MIGKMKWAVLIALTATACFAGDNTSSRTNGSWDLPANAAVELHTGAADMNVVPGDPGKLVVTVVSRRHGEDVTTDFEMQGSTGVLTVHTPKHNSDATVTVRVPRGTDLVLRGTAGDIRVETAGSKDISTTAGDVWVAVGSSKQYADIDVSTHAGDVSGATCGEAKGWVGKSVHCTGQGKDHIRVHTTAGDIELMEGANAEL